MQARTIVQSHAGDERGESGDYSIEGLQSHERNPKR